MVRAPCCAKVGMQKGPWSPNEDKLLSEYIQANGEGQWRSLPRKAGLVRCDKSCRLRWMNYLRPGIKRGNITADEEDLIIRLQSQLGNRWSLIAGKLPGRTDNEIKNHWNTHILKKLKKEGIFHPQKSRRSLSKKSNKLEPKKKKLKKKRPSKDEDIVHHYEVEVNSHEDSNTINVTEAHRPKPIKVCSKSSTINSFEGEASGITNKSSSSNQEKGESEVVHHDKVQEEEMEKMSQVSDISWSSFDQLDDRSYEPRFEFSDENHVFFDDCLLSLHEAPMTDINMLDKVYDEYLQLL